MASLAALPDTCSADEAAALVAELSREFGLPETPSLRTLRLWRNEGQLTRDGRKFTRRNLLEALATVRLRGEGLTPRAVAERVLALDESRLEQLLADARQTPTTALDMGAMVTLQLLAKGILQQHRSVTKGAVVGLVDHERGALDRIPVALHQAMARLSRLYIEEGKEDQTASVHGLLALCTRPLSAWAPGAISAVAGYADCVFVDPTYLVPSEDCEAVCEEADAANLSDLVERHLHEELMATVKKLGGSADGAYREVRRFVARFPMASTLEMRALYKNPDVTDATIAFVESLYVPLHASSADSALVRRCGHCRCLVERGRCVLEGCRDDHPETRQTDPLRLHEARIVRPEVLKFWVDPAREELRLFEGLERGGASPQLYPHCDRCDVSIRDEVGVDVKDYRDPARLAWKLNRSIGGLVHYPRAVLAIADRRDVGQYLARVRELLNRENQKRLEIMSVTKALRILTRDFGKGRSRADRA